MHLNKLQSLPLLLRQPRRLQLQIRQRMIMKTYQSKNLLRLWCRSDRRSKMRSSGLYLKRPSGDGQSRNSRRGGKLSCKLYISEDFCRVMQACLDEELTGFQKLFLSCVLSYCTTIRNFFRRYAQGKFVEWRSPVIMGLSQLELYQRFFIFFSTMPQVPPQNSSQRHVHAAK